MKRCFSPLRWHWASCACVWLHLIGCLGSVASLPPHSRRGTSLCDPWPSPHNIRPRQHSTLEGGWQERAALQEKATRHAPTHTQTPMRNEHTQKDDNITRTERKSCGHTHMQTSYILTKTYIPGNTLDSLTNTHIFIPADIKYKHIQRPYTHVRTWPFNRLI